MRPDALGPPCRRRPGASGSRGGVCAERLSARGFNLLTRHHPLRRKTVVPLIGAPRCISSCRGGIGVGAEGGGFTADQHRQGLAGSH